MEKPDAKRHWPTEENVYSEVKIQNQPALNDCIYYNIKMHGCYFFWPDREALIKHRCVALVYYIPMWNFDCVSDKSNSFLKPVRFKGTGPYKIYSPVAM